MIKIFNSLEEATRVIPLATSELLRVASTDGKEEHICLSHTKDGFFAVQNNCSHAGAALHKGFINEQNEIVCPLHNYCFDLKTGRATLGNAKELKIYRLMWKNNNITQKNELFIDI
ncbi:Rieske (2Fe-2S) protein [Bernardetia sp.]|uniref:Rieske (2Fe-2S) protein n=1 Tax=Bernardetia sp. TaxID=1937974 RepID=UPI0025B81DCA|nr:Rieske 2Fe-2S domain-containing protein [Bernardetia sp.]